jgi:hypothetical protein
VKRNGGLPRAIVSNGQGIPNHKTAAKEQNVAVASDEIW